MDYDSDSSLEDVFGKFEQHVSQSQSSETKNTAESTRACFLGSQSPASSLQSSAVKESNGGKEKENLNFSTFSSDKEMTLREESEMIEKEQQKPLNNISRSGRVRKRNPQFDQESFETPSAKQRKKESKLSKIGCKNNDDTEESKTTSGIDLWWLFGLVWSLEAVFSCFRAKS